MKRGGLTALKEPGVAAFLALTTARFPVVQAPMAGGWTTPALVAAVSRSGGIGFLAGARQSLEQIEVNINAVKAQTRNRYPFGINFQLALPHAFDGEIPKANMDLFRLAQTNTGAGQESAAPQLNRTTPAQFLDSVEKSVNLALEMGVPLIGFALGAPTEELVALAHSKSAIVFGMASTVEEALILEERHVDVIVAQGFEAGGHRTTFDPLNKEVHLVSTSVLVPSILDALKTPIPVLASGGIADGRGLAAALALGACGCQIGTRFLLTKQSGASPEIRKLLAQSRAEDTRISDVVSGRPARVLTNSIVAAHANVKPLPYPLNSAFLGAATKGAPADWAPLLAGQTLSLTSHCLEEDAAAVVPEIVDEAKDALMSGLSSLLGGDV